MLFINRRFIRRLVIAVTAIYVYSSVCYGQTDNEINVGVAPEGLRQFIQQALVGHPLLTAAQAELNAVKAQYQASTNAIYNPELELESEKTDIRTSTIGFSQTIDWGDQRGSKTEIAQHQLNAAKAKFQKQRQQLIRDLLISLVDYKNKTQLSALSNQSLKLMQDFYNLAEQKYAAGDLSQVELDLAQLAYSESLLNNAQVGADQVEAEQSFYALYGDGAESVVNKLSDQFFDFPNVVMPSDLDAFLMSLPQMQIVRATVAAGKNTVALRKSESSADPTVTIWGGKEDEESLLGLSLSIPLNVRNNYSAEISAAESEYLQAEQQAQQTWRDLRREILSQTRRYQLTQKVWQQWRKKGQLSMQRQLKLLKKLWRIGDLSTTDYLVQIKQNLGTQSAGIQLQNTIWTSWLNWLETAAQIESWLQLNNARN